MIGAIANPTKKVTVEFPISQVKDAVLNIPKFYKKYRMEKQNPMFNQYTFDGSEFLSLGVYIDVNLTEVTEKKTEINIEVRRKLGAFDNWVEVQNANEHLQKIVDGISQGISNPNGVPVKEKSGSLWSTVLYWIIAITVLGWIFS